MRGFATVMAGPAPASRACRWAVPALLLTAAIAPHRAGAQPSLDAVRERVEAKDYAVALTLVTQLPPELASRPDVKYLTARLYEDQDKYLEALAALPKEATGLPTRVIRDIAERRARWLARTGRCAEARLMLPVLAERDGPDAELTLRAADCAINQGDAASALALLRNLKGAGSRRFAVRFTLAKLAAQTGDRATAIKDLRGLYVEQPEHSRSSEVEALLRTLVPNLQFTDDERLDRAENWLQAQDHEAALAEIERVKPAKDDKRLKARVLHLRGLVLFRTRTHYDEASQLLSQAAALGGALNADDAYMAAQALARADKDAQAVKAYRTFAKTNPKHRNAKEALHDAAWLELRHDLKGGEAHMTEFLKDAEKRKERELATSALWELAFHSFTKKHCDKAIPMFEKYAQTSPVAMVKARGLYWAGRCALMANKRALGIEHLKTALALEPLHWYSLLSRSRLLSIGVDPGLPFGITAEQATSAAAGAAMMDPVKLPDDVQFYLRLGLRTEALAAMQKQEVTIREGMPGDSLVALSTLYQSLGEFTRPYILASRERDNALKDAPVGTARAVWDTLFPRPYADLVTYAAEEAEVPLELVYAVMRQESAYNPTVVSNANAIGLMQLLERTARDQAEELAWKEFSRPMLFEPRVNVLLGSHFIANLLERYRGQPAPAIAAYNAGEHRVDPWLKRVAKAGAVELDRFVEDIPIDQTRNYVRRVIGNWARYRYLEHPGEWPVDLPLTLTTKPNLRGSG